MKQLTNRLPLYQPHAVKRLLERQLSVDAVNHIAEVGVTVQEGGGRVMKRGEVGGKPVHVVLERPNTIITVYAADEWESTITLSRKKASQI